MNEPPIIGMQDGPESDLRPVAVSEPHIRLATAADADALFEIHQDAIHRFAPAWYGPEHMRIWFLGRTAAIYHQAIAEHRIWLAEAEGQVVGFVGIKPGEIDLLYVRVTAGGRGIGTRLLDHGIAEIRTTTDAPVKVTSLLNAESFYARHGFVKIADDAFERGDPELSYPVAKMVMNLDAR